MLTIFNIQGPMSKPLKITVQRASEQAGPTVVRVKTSSRGRKRRRNRSIVERVIHDAVQAHVVASQAYLRLHERSNRDLSMGWLYDLPRNACEAGFRGQRQFWAWDSYED